MSVLVYILVGVGLAFLVASAKSAYDHPANRVGFYALLIVACLLVLAWWVGLNWAWIGGGQ